MAGPGPDKDVHISLEDQQKINKFARHNQRLEDIKDDMKQKEAELVTLGDASNDVEEFSLTSEDGEKIPYMVGEIFVKETPDDVLSLLDKLCNLGMLESGMWLYLVITLLITQNRYTYLSP